MFDADNHMYETQEALTKFLPDGHAGLIDYVEVNGRTKIAVKGRISEYIPNPTFDRVAAPGAQEEYFKVGNPDGKTRREIMGKAIDALPAFREPAPRLELMDELGLDRALMWPTLASLVEERLRDDPDAIHVVIHALNEWMHETWTFNYEDRIFPTPVITLPIVEKAIEELEWVHRARRQDHPRPPGAGARLPGAPLVRPPGVRPVLGARAGEGRRRRHARLRQRLPALPQRVGGHPRRRVHAVRRAASGFAAIVGHAGRPIIDTIASAIGHGLCTRFPRLKIAPVENGSGWVRRLLHDMEGAYAFNPHLFEEDPVEVFKRNIFVHPFHEEDPKGLVELLGADNVLFGSDYPHPEGMSDPITLRRRPRGPAPGGRSPR